MNNSRIREEIAKTLGGAISVLDVGCGDCSLVRFLAQDVARRATGIDIVAKWSQPDGDCEPEIARAIKCIQGDVHSMAGFPDDVFDAIVTVRTLHELSRPRDALLEMRRVLKRGGRLLVADFSKGHEGEQIWGEKYYTPEEVRGMLHTSGFERVRIRRFHREHFYSPVAGRDLEADDHRRASLTTHGENRRDRSKPLLGQPQSACYPPAQSEDSHRQPGQDPSKWRHSADLES
jgi:SAM-dependent methyltransferase